MDKEILVKSDEEIGALVLDALRVAQVPLTLCDWWYAPQLDEWQLIIATPLYDTQGPHEAFRKLVLALQDAGIFQNVPIRRVFVRGTQDPIVQALEQQVKFKREGTVHIVGHRLVNQGNQYSVIFTPYAGLGGAVPSKQIVGREQLRDFLERKLHIHSSAIEEGLSELQRRGNTSILNVQLTRAQLKRVGLG